MADQAAYRARSGRLGRVASATCTRRSARRTPTASGWSTCSGASPRAGSARTIPDDRVERAYTAKTYGELAALAADLPSQVPPQLTRPTGRRRPTHWRSRRWSTASPSSSPAGSRRPHGGAAAQGPSAGPHDAGNRAAVATAAPHPWLDRGRPVRAARRGGRCSRRRPRRAQRARGPPERPWRPATTSLLPAIPPPAAAAPVPPVHRSHRARRPLATGDASPSPRDTGCLPVTSAASR